MSSHTWRSSILDSGPHDETRSCGNQPAHISLTARRALAERVASLAEEKARDRGPSVLGT